MKTKLILIAALLLFVLCACRTPKNTTKSDSTVQTTEQTAHDTKHTDTALMVDTTKTKGRKLTTIKIEYYPPGATALPETVDSPLPPQGTTPVPEKEQTDKPPNVGAVKSIEITTDEEIEEQRGLSAQRKSEHAESESALTTNDSTAKTTTAQVAPDPYAWRYICIALIVVAVVAALLMLAKKKGWLDIAITALKKLFG